MTKTNTRRSKVKNASLKKNYNSKIRQEYIDLDYIDQLDDTVKNCKLPNGKMVTELEYMSLFMKEWNSGGVGKQKDAKKNAFHRTAKEVKECTDRTNARNRDQYGIAKAVNRVYKVDNAYLQELEDDKRDNISTNSTEDALIDYLDQAKEFDESTDDSDE